MLFKAVELSSTAFYFAPYEAASPRSCGLVPPPAGGGTSETSYGVDFYTPNDIMAEIAPLEVAPARSPFGARECDL